MPFKGAVPRNPSRQGTVARISGRKFTAAMVCSLLWVSIASAELDDIRIRATADATYDDNVSRARKGDKLDDSFATLGLSASVPWQLSARTRLIVSATAAGEKFKRFTGLDRNFANIQGEFQFRNSGQFSEPIWGIFARQGKDWYESEPSGAHCRFETVN